MQHPATSPWCGGLARPDANPRMLSITGTTNADCAMDHDILRGRVALQGILCAVMLACASGDEGMQAPTLEVEISRVIEGDFTSVSQMIITPAGELVATQPADHTVLVFGDGDDIPLHVGRKGEGPGEFGSVSLVGVRQGGFWSYDSRLRRVSFWRLDGTLDSTLALSFDAVTSMHDEARLPGLLGIDSRGQLMVRTSVGQVPALAGIGLADKILFAVDPLTAEVREFARVAGAPRCAVLGTGATLTIPNCASGMIAAQVDGSGVTIVDAVEDGAEEVVVTSVAVNGETTFVVRLRLSGLRIPKQTTDSVRERLSRRAPGVLVGWLPETYPPILRLFIDTDGSTWLEQKRSGAGHHWLVIARNGVVRGELVLPPNVRAMAAQGTILWGSAVDEEGVISLVRYQVTE